MSKWGVVAILVAMLPFAWLIGHNKDADYVNRGIGDFIFGGIIVLAVIIAFVAPSVCN